MSTHLLEYKDSKYGFFTNFTIQLNYVLTGMKFTSEFSWYTSYIDTDMLWLEESLNWDDVFELSTSEYNFLSLITVAAFLNTHHLLDWCVKFSLLDLLLLSDVNTLFSAKFLFNSTIYDDTSTFITLMLQLPYLFYADFQDLVATLVYYSPELVIALRDLIVTQWLNASLITAPALVFDSYQDSTSASNSEFTEYLVAFLPFIAYIFLLLTLTRITTLLNVNDSYAMRAYFYLYSLSNEVRFQFEASIQVFFFVFMYTSMMIATFDDSQEELLEFFNTMCYYFFLFTMVYYLYKYSLHYFSFLEASKGDSKSTLTFSQFLFDALNIIAFVLRFLVLMIRLNIYDSVDDVLDSYYIFMADFDEEEYFSDMLFSLFSVMSFDIDLNDDRSFLFEDELDFSSDLFSVYFLLWGKFAYFWLFILEEIARVSLALYVTYLLIFEINAVNRSFVEDQYFTFKRVL